MKNANQKVILKDIEISNLKLPDIKRIKINYVSDSDADLSSFLIKCTPNQLKFLCINYFATTHTQANSKININSLLKAVAAVTKEVFIRLYEFSAADLQQFVRAACNAERIIFHRCSVHCSSALDFGSKLKYNTNFLSFQMWGSTSFEKLTTDWKSNPSCLSHVVNAISNSGLRHSLIKLSVAYNESLDKAKVQEMMNAWGMAHISIVDESPVPSFE